MKKPLLISATLVGVLALTWWAWPTSSPSAKGKASSVGGTANRSFETASATRATAPDQVPPAAAPASPPGATAAGNPSPPPAVEPSATLRSLLSAHRLTVTDALAAWQNSNGPTRVRLDPFADEAVSALRADSGSLQPEPATLTIQGISINGTRAFAVINRQVVAEGDRVGNWRIETIQPDAVWVRSITAGRIALQLSRTTVPSESAPVPNRNLPLAATTTERISRLPVPVSAPLPRPDPGPH